MGTVHIDDPLDELLNGVTEDEEWDGLSDFENSSDDEFHDAPTTIDEDYPFQPLAPPPTSRSYATYEEAETALYQWTAARGYGLRINRIDRVDKQASIKDPRYRSFVCNRANHRGKEYMENRVRKRNKRTRSCACQMQVVLKLYEKRWVVDVREPQTIPAPRTVL
jgi:hypothetical protein